MVSCCSGFISLFFLGLLFGGCVGCICLRLLVGFLSWLSGRLIALALGRALSIGSWSLLLGAILLAIRSSSLLSRGDSGALCINCAVSCLSSLFLLLTLFLLLLFFHISFHLTSSFFLGLNLSIGGSLAILLLFLNFLLLESLLISELLLLQLFSIDVGFLDALFKGLTFLLFFLLLLYKPFAGILASLL